jgi:hypothetical protein
MATEVVFEDDTRQIIRSDRTIRNRFVIMIKVGGNKDSGTVKMQVSYETSPVAGTDAHWIDVAGLTDMAVGQVYAIDGSLLRANAVAVKCSGSSAALTIRLQ